MCAQLDALEVPATQFACQGLELDYVGLCWGNDLIHLGNDWQARELKGSKWQVLRHDAKRAYQVNTYRWDYPQLAALVAPR